MVSQKLTVDCPMNEYITRRPRIASNHMIIKYCKSTREMIVKYWKDKNEDNLLKLFGSLSILLDITICYYYLPKKGPQVLDDRLL